jgi:hypothetical protein
MIIKRRRVPNLRLQEIASQRRQTQSEKNEDTTARVRSVLAQLAGKDFTVLARYKASRGPDHEIRMGSNNAVYCTGKCWQYSKSGSCKHLDHFKANCVAQSFDRIEKD